MDSSLREVMSGLAELETVASPVSIKVTVSNGVSVTICGDALLGALKSELACYAETQLKYLTSLRESQLRDLIHIRDTLDNKDEHDKQKL